MGKMIVAHVVALWAWGAFFVGALDPLGVSTAGEQAFNGVIMLVVAAGASAWAQRTRAEHRAE